MVVPSSSPPPFTFVKGHGHGLAWSGNSIETSSSVTAETLRTPDDVKPSHTNAETVKSSADVQNGKAVEAISMDEEAQRRVSGAVFSDSDEEMLKNGMPLDDDGDDDDDEGEGEAQHRVENGCSEAENELLKRRVQWNDSHGKELVHVLEFETSDTCDSDDNDDDESQTCTCTIQ